MSRLGLAIGLLLISGCAHIEMNDSQSPTESEISVSQESMRHVFLYGLATTHKFSTVYLERTCDIEKPLSVHVRMTVLDVGISLLTLGLYTPQHVRLNCSAAKSN